MKMNLQKFAGKTNVFPVLDNKFKVGATKRHGDRRHGDFWC